VIAGFIAARVKTPWLNCPCGYQLGFHLDICFYIRKITNVRVESSVQPRISTVPVNFALRYNTDIEADIRADIGATDIGARFTTDNRG